MGLIRRRSMLSGGVLLAAAGLGCSSRDSGGTVQAAGLKAGKDRKTAFNFSLKDADGRTVALSDYKGKVVLLNFWATWCNPCRVEIPWFTQFEQSYKDKGFAVLGVAMDEGGWAEVKPFLGEHKVNYRILMGDDVTAQHYGGVESLPTTFLIDRDGKVASVHVGLVSKSDYENEIKATL